MKTEWTENEWMIFKDPYDKNKYRRKKAFGGKNSFRVHLCPTCNRVHEDTYLNGEGRKTVYHEDFPTYRMKREVCTDCGKL
tara:strand:- start:298 stop:540 length:243 start_codon:yes stop_codon:yes gene_type:complete